MSVPHGAHGATPATPATPSFWDQVPKIVKTVIYVVAGIILLVIIFSVLSWYRNKPKSVASHKTEQEERSIPHTRTLVVSDFLYGVKSRDTVITEEITLDQNVPYSEVTNMDPVFCDGKPIESQGSWGGYKRYRTIKPQSGSAKLFISKP